MKSKRKKRKKYGNPCRDCKENGIGEGMETTQEKLEKVMAEFFTREF